MDETSDPECSDSEEPPKRRRVSEQPVVSDSFPDNDLGSADMVDILDTTVAHVSQHTVNGDKDSDSDATSSIADSEESNDHQDVLEESDYNDFQPARKSNKAKQYIDGSADESDETEVSDSEPDPEQVASLLHKELCNLFRKDVQLARKISSEITELVLSDAESIMKNVNKKDERFGGSLLRLGSFWQNLKVEKPNEYDLGICMKGIGPFSWMDGEKFSASGPTWSAALKETLANNQQREERNYGFNKNTKKFQSKYTQTRYGLRSNQKSKQPIPYSQLSTIPCGLDVIGLADPLSEPPVGHVFLDIKGIDEDKWKDLMRKNDLVPIITLKTFQFLVKESIDELNSSLNGEWILSKEIFGPALKMTTHLQSMSVSVDLVLTIQTKLPFPTWINWPRRNVRWPNSDKIKKILETGLSVVAKLDFYWALSYAEIEKILINGECGDKKKVHRIMKRLNTDYWSGSNSEETEEPVISSYMLKNIWFYEMEHYPDRQDWIPEQMCNRLINMTEHLHKCICQRKLFMYFNPMENLLEGVDISSLNRVRDRIHNFLNNPVGYFQGP